MLKINDFTVSMNHIASMNLQWTIEPTVDELSSLEFIIYRSGAQEGPWEEVGSSSSFSFTDIVNNYSYTRKYFYKITHKDGQSQVATNLHDPDPIALEMIRKKNVYLERAHTAIEVSVLIRKQFGQYCPNCWDVLKQRKTKSNCQVCYGTNFVGGFWSPIDMYLNEQSASKENEKTSFIVGETANYPMISPGDIMIFKRIGRRYRVSDVSYSSRGGYIVSQFSQLKEINRTDVEYAV